MYIGGVFTIYSGETNNRIIKLNNDGSIDRTFNHGTGFDNKVAKIINTNDNELLVGGSFTNYNGNSSNYIIKLTTGGTIDNSFNLNLLNNIVLSLKSWQNNKYLVGGNFTKVSGITRSYITSLNSDGTLDTSFQLDLGYVPGGGVMKIEVISGNTVIIGGSSGTNRCLNILSSGGTVINSYLFSGGQVYDFAVLPDYRILVVGAFTTYNSSSHPYIIRINLDGTIDNSFSSGSGFNGVPYCVARQTDGKYIVGGTFTVYSGQTSNYIIRLNYDGTIDNTFNVGTGFNDSVMTLNLQPDNKIIAGGNFTSFNGNTRNYIARLNSNGSDNSIYPN